MDARFWSRAVASFARNLRHREFVASVATAGLRADSEPRAVKTRLHLAFPETRGLTVPMGDVRYRIWNMDPLELYSVAVLVGARQPKTIFEIGTFDGATTLMMARMAPDAQVFTLDLAPEDLGDDGLLTRVHANAGGVGSRFSQAPEGRHVTQLYGDSRTFDFSPYYGRMDLVLVDGGHEADCVEPDTANALKMVAPGGLVVWDDYSRGWPAVVAAVDGVAERRGLRMVHLVPSEIAVYQAPSEPTAAADREAQALLERS
jgi:predicted O-methyltransferase YrrM